MKTKKKGRPSTGKVHFQCRCTPEVANRIRELLSNAHKSILDPCGNVMTVVPDSEIQQVELEKGEAVVITDKDVKRVVDMVHKETSAYYQCDGSCKEAKSLKTQIKALLEDIESATNHVGELEGRIELLTNDVNGNERAALWKGEALRLRELVAKLEGERV